jgi:CubicO group peptidase (beta-lactamase class C family)
LSGYKKILIIMLLASIVNYNPGAIEKSSNAADKIVPGIARLTNIYSSGKEYAPVERTVRYFMHLWSVTGASVAVSMNGKLVYARGFGYSDTISGEEIQPYHKFRIASISKLITAVAVMKLAEEDKLDLNDRIFGPDAILDDPYFSNPRDKRAYGITVAHLLSHKGGWTQRWGDHMFMPLVVSDYMGMKPPVDTRTIVRFALDKRLHYTPGKGRAYSNLGYSILGLVIEEVTGMPYEEYCRTAILEPLGIYDMVLGRNLQSFRAPFEVSYHTPADVPPKPSIYGTGELVSPAYGGNDIEALGGAGAWLGTAPDLLRLLLAIDGFDTKEDILLPQSIHIMTDVSNGIAPIGWKATVANGTWWRTGSFPGTSAMMKRQSDGIAWVVLFNSSTWNGPEIHSYINRMMYRVISRLEIKGEYDLFDYSLPAPLSTDITASTP